MSGDEIRADERERVAQRIEAEAADWRWSGHWRNGLQHAARLAREPYDTPAGMFVRQTRPGDPCGYCRTTMGESLVCPGCRWVDPPRGRELRESSSSPASGPSSWTGGGRDATADQERVADLSRIRERHRPDNPDPDRNHRCGSWCDANVLLAALDVCRGERDTALSRNERAQDALKEAVAHIDWLREHRQDVTDATRIAGAREICDMFAAALRDPVPAPDLEGPAS